MTANLVANLLRPRGVHERDDAAAEAAARHPRAVHAVERTRDRHHQIELVAADFVVVAQALMRLVHETAERCEVAGGQRLDRSLHAEVFTDLRGGSGDTRDPACRAAHPRAGPS